MAHHSDHHVDRYIPARTNEGWGVVGLVTALAVVCIVAVTYIYQTTYKHPTDLQMESAGAHTPAVGGAH